MLTRGRLIAAATLTAGMTLAGAADSADAAFLQLQMDFDSLRVDAGGAFGGQFHTGALQISADADAVLAAMLVDGGTVTPAPSLASFVGTITLFGGAVTGGQFDVSLTDGSTFTTLLTPGSGIVLPQAGQGFLIAGETAGGAFNGASFGGVDVSGVGTPDGSFVLSSFGPDASGVDAASTLNLTVLPTPGPAALLGLCGLAGLARRRR